MIVPLGQNCIELLTILQGWTGHSLASRILSKIAIAEVLLAKYFSHKKQNRYTFQFCWLRILLIGM